MTGSTRVPSLAMIAACALSRHPNPDREIPSHLVGIVTAAPVIDRLEGIFCEIEEHFTALIKQSPRKFDDIDILCQAMAALTKKLCRKKEETDALAERWGHLFESICGMFLTVAEWPEVDLKNTDLGKISISSDEEAELRMKARLVSDILMLVERLTAEGTSLRSMFETRFPSLMKMYKDRREGRSMFAYDYSYLGERSVWYGHLD
jgi:hypothetical protein